MCGITGVYAFNMVGRVSMINLSNATMALEKRGPDYQNTYNDQVVALGHRRLSIIDTSPKGHQPMTDPSGRYIIIYNGEIYNYRALKAQLEAKGIEFKSGTDTEVLLQLYITAGIACVQQVNGFFAFAIYDKVDRSLFIARDRMGIKPLYFLHDQDRVLFASEMKSLQAYGIDKTLDFVALHTYLQLNYIPAPRTIFRDVKKLLPGHTLFIQNGEVKETCYYKVPYDKKQYSSLSYQEQQTKLSTLLEDSVQKRLVADVPVGAFLSGGIDSSVIAALASKHKPDLHTFSIGYRDEKFFDETAYARLVSKKIQTEHTVFSLTNNDLYEHLNDILDYIDEPFADSSAIAVYILSKETRKHAAVALSGDGADELFSGYNKHSAFLKMESGGFAAAAVGALNPLWAILPKSRSNPLTNKFRQLHKFGKGLRSSPKERYWQWAGYASEAEAEHLLTAQSKKLLDKQAYAALKNDLLKNISDDAAINDVLYTDTNLVLPDDMLTKVDRMSMANSLEVRVPFLDHELVEFAFSLPPGSKINQNIRKRILQDTFRKILPDELYNRPKKGFEVPLLKWLRNEMKAVITHDLLADKFIEQQGIFDVKAIKRLKKKLFSANPGDIHAKIWALIVFQWWWKRYCQN